MKILFHYFFFFQDSLFCHDSVMEERIFVEMGWNEGAEMAGDGNETKKRDGER